MIFGLESLFGTATFPKLTKYGPQKNGPEQSEFGGPTVFPLLSIFAYWVNLVSGIIVGGSSGLKIMVFVKRLAKIFLLLISLLPIIFIIAFIILFQLGILVNYNEEPYPIFGHFVNVSAVPGFVVLFFITFISIPCVLIFYIVDCWRNSRVAKNQKALWTVVLLAGLYLAFPVYWYLYLWRQTEAIK